MGSEAGGGETPRSEPMTGDTPEGTKAARSTPTNSLPQATVGGPVPMDRDPLPLGHPEERQWESACVIQRITATDDAEAGLRLGITAMAADSTCDISIANTTRAIRTIQGVEEGSFSITPFYPENFLI